jgi:hypothetical protein
MSENAEDSVLTKRDHKLLIIAKICAISAWLVLAAYLINSVYQFINSNQIYGFIPQKENENIINWGLETGETTNGLIKHSYLNNLLADPFTATRLISNLFLDIAKGVAAYLILIGLSSGLLMLVETDINYRQRFEGQKHYKDEYSKGDSEQLSLQDQKKPSSYEAKDKSYRELLTIAKDNDPVFYDPNKVTLLIKWIYRSLNILIVLYIVNSLSNIGSFKSLIETRNRPLTNILVEIGFVIVLISIFIIVNFIELKTLAYLLKILKEMEINSRKTTKSE